MDPVVHFEMPYTDKKRMSKFYTAAFGWKANDMGKEMGDYVVMETSEMGKDGFPTKPGRINGGFFPLKNDWPAQYPSVVIAIEDIREAMEKIEKSGGKVLGEPMKIPGVGTYVSFTDTEGNRVSIIQPIMPKGAK
jgi:predicted enzyme related to lactoylglutathione lyase